MEALQIYKTQNAAKQFRLVYHPERGGVRASGSWGREAIHRKE